MVSWPRQAAARKLEIAGRHLIPQFVVREGTCGDHRHNVVRMRRLCTHERVLQLFVIAVHRGRSVPLEANMSKNSAIETPGGVDDAPPTLYVPGAGRINLRSARMCDRRFVCELAAEAFARLGDYGDIISGWFEYPGVVTWIGDIRGDDIAYVMLALIRHDRTVPPVPDVVAIAVREHLRRRGIGGAILRAALIEADRWAEAVGADMVSLSVADDNNGAISLFESTGFVLTPGDGTRYPAGQRCLRMVRPST